ncbi:hypothetical protein SAMN05192583_0094 [Sphingomonas gellani]|uniref:Uncharacterized protein n=1 Tax=Sphingomonas gellani TaxID=1166340 RepID=A0A1H7Y7B6_9SPHN|nr:hypothetical protein [Sphingomonas gellani]SEM41079.1 hypothetical protein SAMN05192583_0094 [Sphingomonas gellani]
MSWLSLIDKKLGTNFDAPQYDPKKGRAKLVKQIETAASQHSEGKTPPSRSWKAGGTEADPAVRYSAKVDGKPVLLDGDATVYVPASRFQDFLKHLKTAVEAGELDKEIKAALDGKKPVTTGSTTRAPRSSTGLGSRSQPDNADWMAKFIEKYGEAPGEGYVPNSKGTKWVSAANAARGQRAATARHG